MPSTSSVRSRIRRLRRAAVAVGLTASGILLALPQMRANAATPTIALSVSSGPGTTALMATGAGFGPGDAVEIYFDGADTASPTADTAGRFSVGQQVPTTAAPGDHWLTAVDQRTQAAAQAKFTVRGNWAGFRSTASGSGLNAHESAITPDNVGTLQPSWTASPQSGVLGSPSVAGGRLFVGSSAGNLLVYPESCSGSCTPSWTAATGAPTSDPTVSGGSVYVVSGGSLWAFATSCGSSTCGPRWKGSAPGSPGTGTPNAPVVSGSRVVVVVGGIVSVFAASGCSGGGPCAPLWQSTTSDAAAGAIVYAGTVFVGSTSGALEAFGLAGCGVSSCAPLWLGGPTDGRALTAPAAASFEGHGVVYVGSAGGHVYAFPSTCSASPCAPTWTGAAVIPGLQRLAPILAAPSVAYGDVYVEANSGLLYAFDVIPCPPPATVCSPSWFVRLTTASPPGTFLSSPAIADGVVFAASNDGNVFAVSGRPGNLAGHAVLWETAAPLGPGSVAASPAVADGNLFVTDGSGVLHALALASPPQPPPRPLPSSLAVLATPIRHVVVLDQENHSFDNVLGYLCVEDARCDGSVTGTLKNGQTIPLAKAPDFVTNVSHSVRAMTNAMDGGRMDGFSAIGGCTQSTGYACYVQYQPAPAGQTGGQIPNLAALARAFVISDRTFETGPSPSWGAHITLAAAGSDGFTGDSPTAPTGAAFGPGWGCDSELLAPWVPPGGGSPIMVPSCVPQPDGSGPFQPTPAGYVPTIMDRMDAASMSWRIYSGSASTSFSDYIWAVCPTFAECIYGPQAGNMHASSAVVTDAQNGTLPNLSLVMPGARNSQHNNQSMTAGDDWIGQVVGAIESGPEWNSTAIFIVYDDCGCFYDHVPPPSGLGIRVPMVIVSPYAKAGTTDSNIATFASMLAYTEHAFGLPPLSSVDGSAYDYSSSFDYTQSPLPGVPMTSRRVPASTRRLMRLHPPNLDDPT